MRFLYYLVFRLLLRLRCAIHDQFLNHEKPPIPPALLRYRVSESLSIPTFLLIGERCAPNFYPAAKSWISAAAAEEPSAGCSLPILTSAFTAWMSTPMP